ncbi:MAG: deaminase [Campylobacteraceae bacterium 4484_4]|nr:MAG: deaminase [Campylobacteraceae bacterium 4484_4]
MQVIQTERAPAAIGPYSQAVRIKDLVFTSGQIPLRPDGTLVEGDIKEETRQVLTNLRAVLEEAGSSLDRIVKTTIYLADMEDFATINGVYAEFFSGNFPARSTVAVRTLPKNVRIEIDAIATA